jgi:hypothetical protein
MKKPGAAEKHALPEHVYTRPTENLRYGDSTVGIFCFDSPSYAHGSGYEAAQLLYRALMRNAVFNKILSEIDRGELGLERQLDIAAEAGYDFIITGEVLYYIGGSDLQRSRVDEQVKVIRVSTQIPVWFAEAVGIGEPVHESDLIFFTKKGKPAPPVTDLMAMNAQKFCNMLLAGSATTPP